MSDELPLMVYIETVPKAKVAGTSGQPSVGVSKIIVRGSYQSGLPLRIGVEKESGETTYYANLKMFGYLLPGYYVNGVRIAPEGSTAETNVTLVLEEKSANGMWFPIASKEIRYNPINTASLWGRIANDMHRGEEQRSIFYFGGPREVPTGSTIQPPPENPATMTGRINVGLESMLYLMRLKEEGLLPGSEVDMLPYMIRGGTEGSSILSKLFLDTKGPATPERYTWTTKSDVRKIFDEISNANVNIIKLSWWGDVDKTFKDANGIDTGIPDNYDSVFASPTFPKTCDFTFKVNGIRHFGSPDEKFCVEKTLTFVNDHPMEVLSPCDCCTSDEDCTVDGEECLGGGCRTRCDSNGCAAGESCFTAFNFNVCYSTYDDCHWPFYYDMGGENECWGNDIFTTEEYVSVLGAGNAAGVDVNDVYHQVFKAAYDKGLLVVPVVELNAYHMFKAEFPGESEDLKERIYYLLDTYGAYPNWLQLYDKNGDPRKAIYLIEAISSDPSDGAMYGPAFDELSEELGVGFILDTTPLGASVNYSSFFTPEPSHLQDMESLLAVNPFGLPFNGWLQRQQCGLFRCIVPLGEYGEDYFLSEAQDWLKNWKTGGVPMVADIIPGYDDRWRSSFLIYGDSDMWRAGTAENAFNHHTAGMSLTIWNGFGEGYVFVPYKKRVFELDPNYISDIGLILSVDGNFNPLYEQAVVRDNYEYAQYLFGEDRDQDGVVDNEDNCPDTPNPMVTANVYNELLSAPCEMKIGGLCVRGGAHALGLATYQTRISSPFGSSFYWSHYRWQPDHDLDGIGDACDYLDKTFTDKNGDTVTGDTWAYSNIINVKSVNTNKAFDPLRPEPFNRGNVDDYVTMESSLMGADNSTACGAYPPYYIYDCNVGKNTTIHYCAINNDMVTMWGDGKCSTSMTTLSYKNTYHPAFNFGFSHGTDEMSIDEQGQSPWNMHISWASSVETLKKDFSNMNGYNGNSSRSVVGISRHLLASNRIFWNWRRDWYERKECESRSQDQDCKDLQSPPSTVLNNNNFHYTLSTGVFPEAADPVNKPSYILNKAINPGYFKNWQKYARSSRSATEKTTLNYHKKDLVVNPGINWNDLVMPLCGTCYLNIPLEVLGPAEDRGSDYGQWSITKEGNAIALRVQNKFVLPGIQFFMEGTDSVLYGVTQDSTGVYRLNASYPDAGPDWRDIGLVENWPTALTVSAAVQNGTVFYLVGIDGSQNEHLYTVTTQLVSTETYAEIEVPTFKYVVEDRGTTGLGSLQGKQFVNIAGEIYLLARNSTDNTTAIRKFDTGTWAFSSPIASALNPVARKVYNVTVAADKLYLAGGLGANDEELKDLWSFDPVAASWTLVRETLTGDVRKLIMREIDGTFLMANPILEFNMTHHDTVALDLGEGIVTYPTVPVIESPDYLLDLIEGYCLNENGTLLKGGTMMSGSCQPFTHPWYKSFSIGTTVYSVAGKGDRLFVGTNSTIRVYDISDPNALVLKSTFTTNKRVYDLEPVEGDILYAATSGGIYKFNTANPNTLSQIKFQSTPYNYQYRIQYYDGKLFVGDDNGINIRDKDSFARLAYINIGSILDFAIANGEIAMYWSAFWDEGVMIRNVENLALKAWEYGYCSTGELTTDHGAFYLSCDGYEYRFVGKPNTYIDFYPLDGDMREMAENHLYNGWVYIPDGNKVKLSTNNTVPSYCGNGIVDPGEICDGNSMYCADLNPSQWNAGTATCDSTCTGWNTGNCYWSGC